MNNSRGLREKAVHALAMVGLVWAVAVLGALFMTTSAQGQHDDRYGLSAARAEAHSTALSVTPGGAPRTAGIALALALLGSGITVLAIGASRGERIVGHKDAAQPDRGSDLSLALGLGLLA